MARIQLSEVDAERAAKIDQGDTVEITLPEIATTGYRWNWTLPAGVRAVHDEYVVALPGRPGQGGQRQLVVEIDRPGRHQLRAELARSWEPSPRRILTFELDTDNARTS